MTPAIVVALLAHIVPLVAGDRPRMELLLTLDQLGEKNRDCTQIAISPDGKWLTLMGYGQFMLWEVSTGKLRQTRNDPPEKLARNDYTEKMAPLLFLGPDRLAAVYELKKTPSEFEFGFAILSVPEFKVETRFPGRSLLDLAADGSTTLSITFKPNEYMTQPTYELWDLKTKKTLHTLNVDKNMLIQSAAFRPDGKELLARFEMAPPLVRPADAPWVKPYVRVFDTATGKEVGLVKDVFKSASLAPDGKTYAIDTGITNASPIPNRNTSLVSIKNRRTGEETYAAVGLRPLQVGNLIGLHYLPDGRHVVVVTNSSVVIWDTAEQGLIKFGGKLSGQPNRVRFTQIEDGLLFATVSYTGEMQVWRVSLPKKP